MPGVKVALIGIEKISRETMLRCKLIIIQAFNPWCVWTAIEPIVQRA